MRHFFSVYKNLENKTTAVDEVSERSVAVKVIAEAIGEVEEPVVALIEADGNIYIQLGGEYINGRR